MPEAAQAWRETVKHRKTRRRWRTWVKQAISPFLGDYQIFRIYRLDLDGCGDADLSEYEARGYRFREVTGNELAVSDDEALRSRAHYSGEDAFTFAVFLDDRIVCAQWIWHSERYRTKRGFWPLKEREAKSIELFTVPEHRGAGLATALKRFSAGVMRDKGFDTLFSRIWFSHEASCRVSEKAGWRNIAVVAEFTPLGLGWTVRLVHKL